MDDPLPPGGKEQWVIWNGSMGVLTLVTVGRIEAGADGRSAYLDPPFDRVGPFSLDELETQGRIAFGACLVMSRQRWQDDQAQLRREAMDRRREQQERLDAFFGRQDGERARGRGHRGEAEEREHRRALNLPLEGELEASQIKKAFRRLAQKTHPDVGGSNEAFRRIMEARNALLERVS